MNFQPVANEFFSEELFYFARKMLFLAKHRIPSETKGLSVSARALIPKAMIF